MNKQRKLFGSRKKAPLHKRLIKKLLHLLMSILGVGFLGIGSIFYFSHPQYDGHSQASFISQDVTVRRDSLGTVTIEAKDRHSISYALGWTHAQERYFQMDLLRRRAAGELSELFGSATLPFDKKVRLHRFRARASTIFDQLAESDQRHLQAYAQGVNDGLNSLSLKPFEYWLINDVPRIWQPEDSLLVVYSMYLTLQESSVEREKALQLAAQQLSPEQFDFLVPRGSDWDAAIDFSEFQSAPYPEGSRWKLAQSNLSTPQKASTDFFEALLNKPLDVAIGSNQFGLAGTKTKSGKALIAGDMHLGLSVPTIWFKAQFKYSTENTDVAVIGQTLPGTPIMVSGTNGHIAWAYTNSYGDYSDAIALPTDPQRPELYQYQDQWHSFKHYQETIKVKNESDTQFEVRETLLGPVETVENNTAWSFLWVAHQTNAMNLKLLDLEQAKSVDSAIVDAHHSAIPAQNFLVGDTEGNIGWTIIGPLPQRSDQSNPFSTLAHHQGKILWLPAAQYPKIINPESGALWTANGRVLDHPEQKIIGNGGYDLGARGRQIRDRLLALNNAEENDLLAIQLDTQSPLHQRWKSHLAEVLIPPALSNHPMRQEFKSIITQWNGRADRDQAGYTLVKRYRELIRDRLLNPLVVNFDPQSQRNFGFYSKHYEAPLWTLTRQQPQEFLPDGFNDYQSFFLAQVDRVILEFTTDGKPLMDAQWGEHNRLSMTHPVSRAIPLLSYWLDRSNLPMPGGKDTPRVQGPTFGASQRMVVIPGALETAIFHMPGGQSGHPFSEYYDSGFDAWVQGTPLPLLPGEDAHVLTLEATKVQ